MLLRTAKPKTAAAKRALQKREPKVVEPAKTALFMKGSTTSELVNDALKDLYALKRPHAKLFSRKNDVHPFEDPRSVEFMAQKNDSTFIVVATHSKKRPHNLALVRTFDHQIMDLVELGITRGMPMWCFEGPKPALGHRPCLIFQGDKFEVDETYARAKNVLMDFFSGETAEAVSLKGLQHVVSVSVDNAGLIHLRCYMVTLLNSDDATNKNLPKVELNECGPALEMELRRTRFADDQLMKEATKVPSELKPKKEKNIERDDIGDKLGRIHMHKQDFSKLQTRKMKGLKRDRDAENQDVGDGTAEASPRKKTKTTPKPKGDADGKQKGKKGAKKAARRRDDDDDE